MTDTTATPPAVDTDDGTQDGTENETDSPVEELLYVDPSAIKIGANVRTDLPNAKELRRSIKERGVIEPVTVYRDEHGGLVCLRGQRRTLTAADVGTPTGLVPVRVVARPEDTDRITDQMVENIHRAGIAEKEVLAGMEQLALLGVSAAQIAKRTALARPTVNAALAVVGKEGSRARVEAGEVTLTEAVIFAEDDPEATARLEQRKRWAHGLEHEAQRLRDEAAERAAYTAEVERLLGNGLPVLAGEEADAARHAVRVSRLRNAEGEPIPEEDWPSVPGAAVLLTEEWIYPDEDDTDCGGDTDDGAEDEYDDSEGYAEPVKVYVPVWVVTDTTPAQEAGYSLPTYVTVGQPAPQTEEQAEARRDERRRVIANNKGLGQRRPCAGSG
jgi:ParB family chromosome partitioning protein